MFSTTHSLTSALIVTRVSSPFISFPLIIVFHYLMDAVPHWDTGTGLSKGKNKKLIIYQTLIDLTIAAIAVFFLFQLGKTLSPKLWLGVLVGISPDLLEAPVNFLNYQGFPLNYLEKFHASFHRSAKFTQGVIPQIIIITAIIILVYLT